MLKIASILVSIFSTCLSLLSFLVSQKSFKDGQKFKTKVASAVMEQTNPKWPNLQVIIPARNEQENIVRCVTSVIEQDYPNFKIMVVNDNSTDQTGPLLSNLKTKYPDKLNILTNPPLQSGWLGKTNAIWQAYQFLLQADSAPALLLFVDVDTNLLPGALKKAVFYLQSENLDLLSLAPAPSKKHLHFWNSSLFWEIVTFYGLAALNPLHPAKPGSVEEALAIGAFILFNEQVYANSGGHTAVKDKITDDVELARQFRRCGYRTALVGQTKCNEVVWYPTLSEIWEGCTKHLFLVAGESVATALAVIAIEWLHKLIPSLTLSLLLLQKKPSKLVRGLNLMAIGLILASGSYFNRLAGVKPLYSLMYPVAIVISTAIMLNGIARKYIWRSVQWKGRKLDI